MARSGSAATPIEESLRPARSTPWRSRLTAASGRGAAIFDCPTLRRKNPPSALCQNERKGGVERLAHVGQSRYPRRISGESRAGREEGRWCARSGGYQPPTPNARSAKPAERWNAESWRCARWRGQRLKTAAPWEAAAWVPATHLPAPLRKARRSVPIFWVGKARRAFPLLARQGGGRGISSPPGRAASLRATRHLATPQDWGTLGERSLPRE